MAAGLPLVYLVCAALFDQRLRKQGVAKWDEDLGLTVFHDKIRIWNAAIVIVFLIVVVLLSALGSS